MKRRNRKYEIERIDKHNRQNPGSIFAAESSHAEREPIIEFPDPRRREKAQAEEDMKNASQEFEQAWNDRHREATRITSIEDPRQREKEWKAFVKDVNDGVYGDAAIFKAPQR